MDEQSTRWNYVLCVQEISSKTALNLLKVFLTRFQEILGFQEVMGVENKTCLYDIKYAIADWTNGNFGGQGGFIALLDEERKKVHQDKKIRGDFVHIEAVGCGDHLLNIAFKHFKEMRDSIFPLQTGAYANLKNLYKQLTGLQKNKLKGFFHTKNTPPPSFGRMTENRFGSFYIAALSIYNNIDLIKEFCEEQIPNGSNFNREHLFGAISMEEVFVMARIAQKCLLPFMKEFNKATSTSQMYVAKQKWRDVMFGTLQCSQKFLEFWGLEGERKTKLEYLFTQHQDKVRRYSQMVLQLNPANNTHTRSTAQKDANKPFFFQNLDLDIEPTQSHLSFCFLIEFASEFVYCIDQRNQKPKVDLYINSGTNRSGERNNAKIRKEFEKQSNSNFATIEAKMKVNSLFCNHTFVESYLSHYRIRPFHVMRMKPGAASYKSLARNRISANALKVHQIEKYQNSLVGNEGRKREDQQIVDIKQSAKLILEIITQNIDPSQCPTQIEEMRSVDDGSEYSEEESTPTASTCFSNLTEKVSVGNLKDCLGYLLAKSFLYPVAPPNKKKDGLKELFLEISAEFLKLDDTKHFFQEKDLTIQKPRDNPNQVHLDKIQKLFEQFVKNDEKYMQIYKDSHYTQIINSTENTLLSFSQSRSKTEFINALKRKFSEYKIKN